MTIYALIQFASENPLQAEHVDAAVAHLRVTVEEMYDLFATSVAQRYLSGELSYTLGDAAMSGLFTYATSGGGPELSRLAWQVFEAFDEGEYLHAGEEQGEARTKMLLAKIAELGGA